MNQTMRERVWALKDAGKPVPAIAHELAIDITTVRHYLRRRVSERYEREQKAFEVFRAAMTRGEPVKVAASDAGVSAQTGGRWAKRIGMASFYATEAERQDIIARRRDAERAAMLPAVKLEVAK
jgi:hypothetical protein